MNGSRAINNDIELRPMEVPRDCSSVARIRSACFPAWPVTTDEVADEAARRVPERRHRSYVAIDGSSVAGYGYLEEPAMAAHPGRLRIRVLVDPTSQGRGIGGALYALLLQLAREVGTAELVTEAQADDDRAVRFLTERGFAEYHRRVEGRLRLAQIDTGSIGRGIDVHTDALFATGVRIATYQQMQFACIDAPRRLYDLDAELWRDVPFGLTGNVPSYERYLREELEDPNFLPEATFIALAGERWIGLCALMTGPGCLLTSMTGVARDWRGRGLARWLKLHTIRYALENGCQELRVFNDDINDAMLGLNRSLGFRVAAVEVRYRKQLQ
jgi:mycothiol synthase